MKHDHLGPGVLNSTDSFYVKVCDCGIVHLSFGCTVVNLAPMVALAVSETLKQLTDGIRPPRPQSARLPKPPIDNVVIANFRPDPTPK